MAKSMFVKAAEVEPVGAETGVWRRILVFGDKVMLVHIALEEGAIVPNHKHPNEQAGYVVEGEMLLTIAGQSRTVKAGESYLIPYDAEHGAKAIAHTIIIESFSPPREDLKPQL